MTTNDRKSPGSLARTARKYLLAAALACLLFAGVPAPETRASEPAPQPCRVNDGPCTHAVGSILVTFELSPRPVKVMRELDFSVMVTERGTVVNDASISVSLTMPGMVMGTNTIILRSSGNGRYEGKGVIVRCPTGQKAWKAVVAVRRGGRTVAAPFLFEVH